MACLGLLTVDRLLQLPDQRAGIWQRVHGQVVELRYAVAQLNHCC